MLRDPTDHAVSYFFHHLVSRRNTVADSANLNRRLSQLSHYYLQTHNLVGLNKCKPVHTAKEKVNRKEKRLRKMKRLAKRQNQTLRPLPAPRNIFSLESYKNAAQDILRDYQFIGIQERFDESLVVLNLLIGVSLGDMLYLFSKIKWKLRRFLLPY